MQLDTIVIGSGASKLEAPLDWSAGWWGRSRKSRIHHRIRFEVDRDSGMRRAGRLDVQLDVGELSVITSGCRGERRALLPLERVPAGAMDLLSSIYQRGFVTETAICVSERCLRDTRQVRR